MKEDKACCVERRPVDTCDACVGTDEVSQEDSEYCCNICLELSKEPVVTLCGHLFCWSCLFRSVLLSPAPAKSTALRSMGQSMQLQMAMIVLGLLNLLS